MTNDNQDNLPAIEIQSAVTEIAPVAEENLIRQVQAIQSAMKSVMKEDVHFGKIPGTDKPTLLKPGAEKIGLMFRLAPTFDEQVIGLADGHREIRVKCTLTGPNGRVIAQGLGVCTTMEAKYRWRKGERKCPKCNSEAIIKGKAEYGGGWLCFGKKGGCGEKFAENDSSITSQVVGRVPNPDIADTYNTVLKMALKRAHVGAIISGTAASDIFNQDIGDPSEYGDEGKKKDVTSDPSQSKQQTGSPGASTINWDDFKYKYHLPHKKAGVDMEAIRKWLSQNNFKYRGDDQCWYSNMFVAKIANYLRDKDGKPVNLADIEPDQGDLYSGDLGAEG